MCACRRAGRKDHSAAAAALNHVFGGCAHCMMQCAQPPNDTTKVAIAVPIDTRCHTYPSLHLRWTLALTSDLRFGQYGHPRWRHRQVRHLGELGGGEVVCRVHAQASLPSMCRRVRLLLLPAMPRPCPRRCCLTQPANILGASISCAARLGQVYNHADTANDPTNIFGANQNSNV